MSPFLFKQMCQGMWKDLYQNVNKGYPWGAALQVIFIFQVLSLSLFINMYYFRKTLLKGSDEGLTM